MPCFGYKEDSDEIIELKEITLQMNSKDLRELSRFLTACAEALENNIDWEHEHISDFTKSIWSNFDVIVFRP